MDRHRKRLRGENSDDRTLTGPSRASSSRYFAFGGVTRASKYLAASTLALGVLSVSRTAWPQSASAAPDIRVTVGSLRMFLDEPAMPGFGVGIRLPVSARLAFEPELLRITGDRFDGWNVDGNASWTFAPAARARPYVITGAGLSWQREKAIRFTHREPSISAGGGLRVFVTRRAYVGAEARVGSAAFPRVTLTFAAELR